jgi:hypothetical protein
MRGGQNKKTLEQHVAEGTYRADRHGLRDTGDAEVLQKMKYALYKKFKKVDEVLDKTEIGAIDKDTVSYYLSVIKTFDIITKNPTPNHALNKKEAGSKDGKMEL